MQAREAQTQSQSTQTTCRTDLAIRAIPRLPARLEALAERRTIKPHTRSAMHHKFKVGQLVDYNPGRVGMPASSWQYKIVRLLPAEGSDLLYRIKSLGETFERVARERELAAR
jgi:hypothetical protein